MRSVACLSRDLPSTCVSATESDIADFVNPPNKTLCANQMLTLRRRESAYLFVQDLVLRVYIYISIYLNILDIHMFLEVSEQSDSSSRRGTPCHGFLKLLPLQLRAT